MNKVTLEEFDKAINELPKTNDIVSTFSSVSVKELRKAVKRFEYVPSFDDLLKENNRLNNIIDKAIEYIGLRKEICQRQENVIGENILVELLNILKGEDK